MGEQVIKIKPADLTKAAVRAFGRSAWEAGKSSAYKSKLQPSRKNKEPRYKSRFHGLEEQ